MLALSWSCIYIFFCRKPLFVRSFDPLLWSSTIGLLHSFMQDVDTSFKEIQLFFSRHLFVKIDHSLACFMDIEEMDYWFSKELDFVKIFSCFSLFCFHVLVNLDALKGSNLSYVLLKCHVATAHSYHDLVCFKKKILFESSNHEHTSLFGRIFVNVYERKIGQHDCVQLIFWHFF